MINTVPVLQELDRAIALVNTVLRARFHTSFDCSGIIQLIIVTEGLATAPKNFGDITDYQRILSRAKLPVFGTRLWKIYSSHCLSSLPVQYEQRLALLNELSEMMAGYFRSATLLRRSKNKMQLLLQSQTHFGLKIMYMLGVKRQVRHYSHSNEVKEYSYEPYVKLLKVTSLKELHRAYSFKFIQRVIEIWKNYEYTFEPEELWPMSEANANVDPAVTEAEFVIHGGQLKDHEVAAYLNNTRLAPPKYYMHEPLQKDKEYAYDPNSHLWQAKRKIDANEQNIDGAIPSRRVNPDYNWSVNTKLFAEFLQSIPNFRVNLTEEQLDVVGMSGNIVLIGRSGTGKTTTSVLRLFALEVVYKLKTLRQGNKDALFKAEHLGKSVGLHSIFATASPVLTNEIFRYYKAVTCQVREELQKKEKKLATRKATEEAEDLSKAELIEEQQDEANQRSVLTIHNPAEEANQEGDCVQQNVSQKFSSLREVSDDDFPLFLTIKQLILMVDQCLTRPFFYNSTLSKGVTEKRSGWYSEEKGIMFIDNYFRKVGSGAEPVDELDEVSDQDEDFNQQQEEEETVYRNRFRRGTGKKKTFEVDYDYFRDNFWDLVKSSFYYRKINCHLVWTEIYSVIKGSTYSGASGLTLDQYLRQANEALSTDQKMAIHQVFTKYQRWKFHVGAYDLMDVVNYILQELTYSRVSVSLPSIDYIMVDEVQDLCCATIKLLTKLCKCNIFCSGDSAQTIAKGVGFRFGDLKSIVQASDGSFDGGFKQLTQNFRSQNSILQLAHSVIEVIQELFPETIDILKKESSRVNGPKPILLSRGNVHFINKYFVGSTAEELPLNRLEFGCEQVVIVRSQESKKHIPSFLKYALVLTIYECKGLEFNDVIVCNFFEESPANWSLLHILKTLDDRIVIDTKKKLNEKKFMHSQICSELKLLYTAVTRAKRSLIIYDDSEEKRAELSRLWEQLDLVMTSEALVAENNLFVNKSTPSDWTRQGYKMLSKQLYEQALDCFAKADNTEMATVCQSYIEADKAVELTKTVRSNAAASTKAQNKLPKKTIKEMKRNSIAAFVKAGEGFESCGRLKEAARCYFSAKKYHQALTLFERLQLAQETAECLFMLKDYAKSAEWYGRTKNISKQIECLDLFEDWEGILSLVNQNRSSFTEEERNALVTKYCNLAYSRLMREISANFDQKVLEPEIDKHTENKKDIVEEEDDEEDSEDEDFASRKKQAAEIVILEEERELEDESKKEVEHLEESSVVELKDSKIAELPADESQFEEVQQLKQPTESIDVLQQSVVASSEVVSLREEQHAEQPLRLDQSKDSFMLLNEPDLQSVRSYVDPEDEFLGSSLSEIRKDTFSEYSVIGETVGVRANMIKTKGNIFLEDSVMKRLIKIVEASSPELSKYLRSLRAQKTLMTLDNRQHEVPTADQDFQEEISPQLVGLVLDTLQSFGYYRMCIFVCNRYNMPDRLGRYLVSIAHQYSIVSGSSMKATFNLLSAGELRKSLLEKAVIACVAIHNAFEIINPEFFSLNSSFENALGKYCVKGLLYLGMYKKAVFMMSAANCLNVLRLMFDYNMYAEVFLSKVRGLKKFEISEKYPPTFYCQELPTTDQEVDFALLAVQRQVELLIAANEYTHFMNQRIAGEKITAAGQYVSMLPKYFVHLRQFAEGRSSYFVEFLSRLSIRTVRQLPRLERYDLITTSLLVLSVLAKDTALTNEVASVLLAGGFERITTIVEFYKGLVGFLQRYRSLQAEPNVVSDIVAAYGVRLVDCEYLNFLGGSVVIQRGSTVADQAIKSKNILYVVEQGINVLAGDTRSTITIVMDKISVMLAKLKEVFVEGLNDTIYQKTRATKEELIELTKGQLLLKYFEGNPMKQKASSRSRYAKCKVGTMHMRKGGLVDDYYAREIELSEDEEDTYACDRVELLCELPGIPSLLRNFVLLNNCNKEEALKSYVPLLQAGLHRHFNEMVSGTSSENLFQAMEFRRFGLLDDYLYHLELALQLQNIPFHFELSCEAVCLLSLRCVVDANSKSVLADQSILRFLDMKDNAINVNFSSQLSQTENSEILKRLVAELSFYSTLSSTDNRRELLFGVLRFVILNVPEYCLTAIANELSLLRPLLQSLAHEPLRSSLNKTFSLVDTQFRASLRVQDNWLGDGCLTEIAVINCAHQILNEANANADYEQFEAQSKVRLTAAAKIKELVVACRKKGRDRQHWLRISRELVAHLNSEFYQRTGLTALDVHYLLERIERLCELQRKRKCCRQTIQPIFDETGSWMANESEKFEVRELRSKAIREVKWFARSSIGKKAQPYKKVV